MPGNCSRTRGARASTPTPLHAPTDAVTKTARSSRPDPSTSRALISCGWRSAVAGGTSGGFPARPRPRRVDRRRPAGVARQCSGPAVRPGLQGRARRRRVPPAEALAARDGPAHRLGPTRERRRGRDEPSAAPVEEASTLTGSEGSKPESTPHFDARRPTSRSSRSGPPRRAERMDGQELRERIHRGLTLDVLREIEDQMLTGTDIASSCPAPCTTAATSAGRRSVRARHPARRQDQG